MGRYGAPPVAELSPVPEGLTVAVLVFVVGFSDDVSVTVRVTMTVEGLPPTIVVCVVVMVCGETGLVEL